MTPQQKVAGGVAGGLSAAVAALVMPLYLESEGMKEESYRDSVGIWTICAGHTGPEVGPDQRKTLEQCRAILLRDFQRHNEKLVKCVPNLMPPHVHAAVLDWSLNAGPARLCDPRNTLGAKLRAGDWAGACREFPKWVMDQGKDCRIEANRCGGQPIRRAREQALCEGREVPPAPPASLGATG